jgi:hypothetical protein
MEDARALQLFGEYLKSRRAVPPLGELVSPPDLIGDDPIIGSLAIFYDRAQDTLRELSNALNDFYTHINVVNAWLPIYSACEQGEKLDLLIDHILPVSTLALGAPQALRGRLLFAAAMCCDRANFELFRDDPQLHLGEKTHLTMKVASKIGRPWEAWKELPPIFEELRGLRESEITTDFRNQREHGHPRRIGIGLTSVLHVEQTEDGKAWSYGVWPPIEIETVVAVSVQQHAVACRAYSAYKGLIAEQLAALKTRAAEFE